MSTSSANSEAGLPAGPIFPATWQIPVDFTISKAHLRYGMTVRDAYMNKVYRVSGRWSSSSSRWIKTLLDADGSPLISVVHFNDGWQGYRGNRWEREDLVFTVKKICDSKFRSELEVSLAGTDTTDQHSSFRLKGNPFWRSCTIYSSDAVIAQTNPLYRLGKVIYSRHKFRLTVYPGIDHSLVIAMLMTFFS